MGVPCNSSEDMGWPATKEALLHQPCNGFTPGLSTCKAYLIIVADAADAVSVNFSGRCKFLQI